MISLRLATLHELSSVYGLEDCYDLLDIHDTDTHNRLVLAPKK